MIWVLHRSRQYSYSERAREQPSVGTDCLPHCGEITVTHGQQLQHGVDTINIHPACSLAKLVSVQKVQVEVKWGLSYQQPPSLLHLKNSHPYNSAVALYIILTLRFQIWQQPRLPLLQPLTCCLWLSCVWSLGLERTQIWNYHMLQEVVCFCLKTHIFSPWMEMFALLGKVLWRARWLCRKMTHHLYLLLNYLAIKSLIYHNCLKCPHICLRQYLA